MKTTQITHVCVISALFMCNIISISAASHQEKSPSDTPVQIDIHHLDLDSLWNSLQGLVMVKSR